MEEPQFCLGNNEPVVEAVVVGLPSQPDWIGKCLGHHSRQVMWLERREKTGQEWEWHILEVLRSVREATTSPVSLSPQGGCPSLLPLSTDIISQMHQPFNRNSVSETPWDSPSLQQIGAAKACSFLQELSFFTVSKKYPPQATSGQNWFCLRFRG